MKAPKNRQPASECSNVRGSENRRPSAYRQCTATGTVHRNAARPDHRCRLPVQDGACTLGSRPYIASAEQSCTSASVAATVVSQTLTVSGLEKPARLTPIPVGACRCPYTPMVIATRPPISTGTSSVA